MIKTVGRHHWMLLLGFCLQLGNAAADFQVKEFNSGAGLTQTALVDSSRLVVFSHHGDDERTMQLFDLVTSEALEEPVPVPGGLIFADEMVTAAGPRVAMIFRDHVKMLGSDAVVLQFDSIYNAPVYQLIPRLDAFRDLNGDGLDDFLIPSFDGFQVAVQSSEGGFSRMATLGAVHLMDMSYNSHPWYQAKSLFNADLNGDGRPDLAIWKEGAFHVYSQLDNGQFSERALVLACDLELDFDSVDGMSLRFSNQDQSDKTVKVIQSLADYNGDGVTDLMAMQVKSSGVLNKTTTFALHPGEVVSEAGVTRVAFAEQPVSSVQSNGIQYQMLARDIDSDGDLDLMISSVELGVGKLVGALLTSSIKIDLGFFPMRDGQYNSKAATTRSITATFSLTSGEYWLPAVEVLDHNQDGRLDLLIQDSDVEMRLHTGEATDRLFATRGKNLRVAVPKDPDLIRQIDVNGDKNRDLLMQVPPPLGETTGHRVIMLISQP